MEHSVRCLLNIKQYLSVESVYNWWWGRNGMLQKLFCHEASDPVQMKLSVSFILLLQDYRTLLVPCRGCHLSLTYIWKYICIYILEIFSVSWLPVLDDSYCPYSVFLFVISDSISVVSLSFYLVFTKLVYSVALILFLFFLLVQHSDWTCIFVHLKFCWLLFVARKQNEMYVPIYRC